MQKISLSKYFFSIGVTEDIDDPKYSKETGKKTQASSNKVKEKDSFDMESLTKYLKLLMNKVSELKRRSSEVSTTNNKSFRPSFFKKNNNSQLAKSSQSSNVLFNIEILDMDNLCSFHQEKHSENTCRQWNHNMNTMMANMIDTLLAEEQIEQSEETNEIVVIEES